MTVMKDPDTDADGSTFYTTSSVARTLDTSEANVRKLADSGRLPHIRTKNGTRLYRSGDVQRLARERRG